VSLSSEVIEVHCSPRNVPARRHSGDVEDEEEGDGVQEILRLVKVGQRGVSEESDVHIVNGRHKPNCVSQKPRQQRRVVDQRGVYDGEKDMEQHQHREEGIQVHVEAVSP